MKVLYALKGDIYEATDVELALQFTEAASAKFGWAVRVQVESLSQKTLFSGVADFSLKDSNHFAYRSIDGEISTRRQYQGSDSEIVVTVCPTIEMLQKLQQFCTRIKLLIVVPEMKASTDIYHWLDLNSATDIETGVELRGIGQPHEAIRRAIGYLKDYCQRMTIDLTHTPVHTGELAGVANTLKVHGIGANYEEVLKSCIQKGLSYAEADILAKAFCQKSKLQERGCPDYDVYWKSINDPKWD